MLYSVTGWANSTFCFNQIEASSEEEAAHRMSDKLHYLQEIHNRNGGDNGCKHRIVVGSVGFYIDASGKLERVEKPKALK